MPFKINYLLIFSSVFLLSLLLLLSLLIPMFLLDWRPDLAFANVSAVADMLAYRILLASLRTSPLF
jgi:hypothetical protein